MMCRRGGRFAKAPSLEDLGLPVAHEEMVCANCGHRWHPILTTGNCPQCGAVVKRHLHLAACDEN